MKKSLRPARSRLIAGGIASLLLAVSAQMLLAGPVLAGQSGSSGPRNDISDVPGILVGHAANAAGTSGVTVLRMPATATAGVDVRGGSPISREGDLLKPTNEVQKVDAIMLAGGGESGLAAGPGVMRWLAEQNQGFQVGLTPDNVVPIVPGSALNDVRPGQTLKSRVGYNEGYAAVKAAGLGAIAQGNVGAGLGAIAGGIKGGLGSASFEVYPGIFVAALVVVNSTGSVVDPTAGCKLFGAPYGVGTEFAGLKRPAKGCGTYQRPTYTSGAAVNHGSVLGVVATNLTLDKPMDLKLAEAAHDGTTRALGQAHGMFDGDTFYGISTDLVTPDTGALPECLHDAIKLSGLACQLVWNSVIAAAQETVARAITHAVVNAKSTSAAKSYCDTFVGACTGANAASTLAPLAGANSASATPAPRETASMLRSLDSPLALASFIVLAVLAGAFGLRRQRRALGALGALLTRSASSVGAAAAGRWRPIAAAVGGLGVLLTALGVLSPAQVSSASSPTFPTLQASCNSDAACLAVIDRVGEAGKRTMARAIVHASIAAKSRDGVSSYCDNFPTACVSGPSGYPSTPGKTGKYNNITDVPGIKVGAYTDPQYAVGTTVMLTPPGSVGGVEVRGSAPGGRSIDALKGDQSSQPLDAITVTGGSAFGLAAGDGVAQFLEERGKGTKLNAEGSRRMPSVPTAVIFDLGRFGKPWLTYATPTFGYKAAKAAVAGPLAQGNVGAGAGAQTGSLKGGIGYASEDLGNGLIVASLVNINPAGLPYDLGSGCTYLGARYQLNNEFKNLRPPAGGCGASNGAGFAADVAGAGKNTTIGIVATNLPMTRQMLGKFAQYGQDGLGAAIRPSHTYFDGDTVFGVSTNGYGGTLAQASAPKPAAPKAKASGAIPALAALDSGQATTALAGVFLGVLPWGTRRARRRRSPALSR